MMYIVKDVLNSLYTSAKIERETKEDASAGDLERTKVGHWQCMGHGWPRRQQGWQSSRGGREDVSLVPKGRGGARLKYPKLRLLTMADPSYPGPSYGWSFQVIKVTLACHNSPY